MMKVHISTGYPYVHVKKFVHHSFVLKEVLLCTYSVFISIYYYDIVLRIFTLVIYGCSIFNKTLKSLLFDSLVTLFLCRVNVLV